MLTNQLYNYASFFKKILHHVTMNYIEEMVTVVEYRHIFGMLFDDDGPLSLDREMLIFQEVYNVIRTQFPLFRIKIIVCGLKIVGKDHIQAMLDAMENAQKLEANSQTGYQLVCGFDMVNEEDYN
jgi:hypothetical protein